MDKKEKYEIYINSKFKKGYLSCAEIYLPGKSKKKFFFTYICHPSMANNELSGPILSVFLSQWLKSLKIENGVIDLFLYQKLLVRLLIFQKILKN